MGKLPHFVVVEKFIQNFGGEKKKYTKTLTF